MTRGGLLLAALAAANGVLGVAAFMLYHHVPVLLGTALLAYGFGLRHAVDADHIAAIDNVTRKLMSEGQRPMGVGFFFSLGHSTVVFLLSAAVAVAAVAIKGRFAALAQFGGIFGTLVSAGFLLAIALVNLVILAAIIGTLRRVRRGDVYAAADVDGLLARRGFFARLFRALFRLVRRDWQMYLVGLLFGLGFDTATEVGLLGISASAASHGLPVWSIMMFPALFAAGMALVDTAESFMMIGAYGWAAAQPMRKLFYNITVTGVSVLVALVIGGIEVLGLVQAQNNPSGQFWDGVAALNNHFGMLGFAIVGIFAGAWGLSAALYKDGRRDEAVVRAE
jgi:high-affinity nickel-transport protein